MIFVLLSSRLGNPRVQAQIVHVCTLQGGLAYF